VTTTLLVDEAAWTYPGGTCRLRGTYRWYRADPGELAAFLGLTLHHLADR
jgi:hypothetical protein